MNPIKYDLPGYKSSHFRNFGMLEYIFEKDMPKFLT